MPSTTRYAGTRCKYPFNSKSMGFILMGKFHKIFFIFLFLEKSPDPVVAP
jgi:hypothetical protein